MPFARIYIKKWLLLPLLLIFFAGTLSAQTAASLLYGDSTRRLSTKELTIPENPVFDLMGVTPAQVTRMSDIKDVKVDWSFKSWKLNPNIAIEGQPVWELFYGSRRLRKYQQAGSFMRMLSSLDVSGGTIQSETGDRRIGVAVKLSLYRQKDPLLMNDYYADVSAAADTERSVVNEEIRLLARQLDTVADVIKKHTIMADLSAARERLVGINAREREEIQQRAKIIISENWNASSVNIAGGKIFTYTTDSAGNLKRLLLNRNTAYGAWVNWGVGIGKKVLLSGLLRTSFYEELLQFNLQNTQTGEVTTTEAVAGNTLFTAGLNLRYGSSIFSFFTEFIYDRKGLRTPPEALAKVFSAPAGTAVVNSSVQWDVVHPYTITFGGDWRMGRNVMLSFGIRSVFSKTFKNTAILPVATVACLMR